MSKERRAELLKLPIGELVAIAHTLSIIPTYSHTKRNIATMIIEAEQVSRHLSPKQIERP